MKLKRLKIERALYGKDEGKLLATIEIDDEKNCFEAKLSEEASLALIRACAHEVGTAASMAALTFRDNLMRSLEEKKPEIQL